MAWCPMSFSGAGLNANEQRCRKAALTGPLGKWSRNKLGEGFATGKRAIVLDRNGQKVEEDCR